MTTTQNANLGEALLVGVTTQLGLIIDREFTLDDVRVEVAHARPAGEGAIHISFRFAFCAGERELHGCLLMPLPDAIALANYLLMATDDDVAERRPATDLDRTTKEAMLEVSNFMAGAMSGVVRDRDDVDFVVRTAGCQGVRDGVRPALDYAEGSELLVVRARAQIHDWPEFELIAMMPPLVA